MLQEIHSKADNTNSQMYQMKNPQKDNDTSYYSNKKTFNISKRIINPFELLSTKSQPISKTKQIPEQMILTKEDFKKFPIYLNESLKLIEGVYNIIDHNTKIETLLKIYQGINYKTTTRLGALIGIYLLLSKVPYTNTKEILCICLDILQHYQNFSQAFLICAIDIISLINDKQFLTDNINIISLFLTDDNFPFLQDASFNCLFRIGYEGIKHIVDICKFHSIYQKFLLNKLIATPHIQHIIIVRALVNDLLSGIKEKINKALYALNQLYWVVSGEDEIEYSIAQIFNDDKIDKNLIASTLRTSGEKGIKILLDVMKNHSNFSVRAAACKVFQYKIKEENFIKIKLNFNNNTYYKNKGVFLNYYGKNYAVCSEEYEAIKEENENYIEIYSEEFLATLNRMLGLEFNHEKLILDYKHNSINSIFSIEAMNLSEKSNLYPLKLYYDDLNPQQNEKVKLYEISKEIISSLCVALKDKQSLVRLSASKTLGKIGEPDAHLSLKHQISQVTNEKDPAIISSFLNSISTFLTEKYTKDIISLVKSYIKSHNNQVQLASLALIPHLKEKCPEDIINFLTYNILNKEVNKVTYAKALLSTGDKGESILINLLDKGNFKIQANISNAFMFSDPNSPNIDFIIEALLKKLNSQSALVRKNSLLTLSYLSKYKNVSTFLEDKNILDIYYKNLSDFDEQIGYISMNNIIQFGAKGELMLIQGALRDKNAKVRIFCLRGLSEIGVHNFSTLIISYFQEKEDDIHLIIDKLLLEKFKEGEVVSFYKTCNQKEALCTTLRDILEKKVLKPQIKNYFTNIYTFLIK